MPEILTKHPKIVKKILENTGKIHCGKGNKKQILKKCPNNSFCSLPTGELCIYDYKNINQMTQLSAQNILSQKKTGGKHCSICHSTSHIKSNKKYH